MRKLLIICALCVFAGCISFKQESWENPKTMEESLLVIDPDDLTPAQSLLMQKIERLVWDFVDVEDNKLVLREVDSNYWKKHGINPVYEVFIKEALEDTNRGTERLFKDGWLDPETFDLRESLMNDKAQYFANHPADK